MGIDTMLNSEYWKDRAERIIDEGEKTALQLSKDLKKLYTDTIRVLQDKINAFYGKYSTETGLTMQDLKQKLVPFQLKLAKKDIELFYKEVQKAGGFSPQYANYLKTLSEKTYITRMEQLQLQMRHEIELMYRSENIEFTSKMTETYDNSYYKTNFNIQQGIGISVSFNSLNTKIIKKAIETKWLGANYSDRIWQDKEKLINSLEITFLRGIVLGENPNKIGKNMAEELDTKLSNGVRLARTELNHICNQATLDSYKQYNLSEQYKYLATLDEKTCKICGPIDKKIFNIVDSTIGVNFAPMHPNCRCTSTLYLPPSEVTKLFKKTERIARNPITGKNYYVPFDMTYEEWRNSLTEEQGKALLKHQKQKEKKE